MFDYDYDFNDYTPATQTDEGLVASDTVSVVQLNLDFHEFEDIPF